MLYLHDLYDADMVSIYELSILVKLDPSPCGNTEKYVPNLNGSILAIGEMI